ncbi:MAG TPA: hypothetical protein VF302_07055 [Candidatus Limnocylindrales bacterium]
MIRRNALLLIVATALAACGQPAPSASPAASLPPSPSIVTQQHTCGDLAGEVCEAAIAAVTHQVPDAARSRIAVAATRDPSSLGDLVVLVAFAPWDQGDYAFNPPTWVTSQPTLTAEWQVEPWRDGPLPARFLALLRKAGIVS